MKHCLAWLALILACPPSLADPLEGLRGNHRVLVLDFPEGTAFALAQVERQIRKGKAAARDRDIVYLHVGELGHDGRAYAEKLTEAERAAIREKWKLGETKIPAIYLIGKDGTGKAVQRGLFDLNKFFRLIDTMPMRKREVEERG